MIEETGCHGIAIGRGALAEPVVLPPASQAGSRPATPARGRPTHERLDVHAAARPPARASGRGTRSTAASSSARSRRGTRKALRLPKERAAAARDAREPGRVRGRDRAVRARPARRRAGASGTLSRRRSPCPRGRSRTGELSCQVRVAARRSLIRLRLRILSASPFTRRTGP